MHRAGAGHPSCDVPVFFPGLLPPRSPDEREQRFSRDTDGVEMLCKSKEEMDGFPPRAVVEHLGECPGGR